MTNPIARQPKGIPTGGQFATTTHPESGVALEAPPAYATARDVIAADTSPVDLRFVAYDESLSEEQIELVLAGDWTGVENDVDERYADSAYERAVEIAREQVDEAYEEGRFDRSWDELDPDEQDEARWAVEERDESAPLKDLLRNTHKQLMRTSMGQPMGRLADRDAVWGSRMDHGGLEHRRDAIASMLADSGLDASSPEAQEAITELVENGPWDWHEGVQLDVIFYDDIADLAPSTSSDADEDAGKSRELEFTNPRVLLIDKWNGSGHDVRIPGTLKRTLGQPAEGRELDQTQRVYLDSKAGGYSWDDVCGLHKPAYADGAPRTSWANAR